MFKGPLGFGGGRVEGYRGGVFTYKILDQVGEILNRI